MYLDGHGEAKLDGRANHDLGDFGTQLRVKGFKTAALNLATARKYRTTSACWSLPARRVDLLPGETCAIRRWLEKGGNLLWLVDNDSLHGLQALADELGLEPGRRHGGRSARGRNEAAGDFLARDRLRPAPHHQEFHADQRVSLCTSHRAGGRLQMAIHPAGGSCSRRLARDRRHRRRCCVTTRTVTFAARSSSARPWSATSARRKQRVVVVGNLAVHSQPVRRPARQSGPGHQHDQLAGRRRIPDHHPATQPPGPYARTEPRRIVTCGVSAS